MSRTIEVVRKAVKPSFPETINPYRLLNEGIGGCYERIVYSNIISDIAEKAGCRSILELNTTFIAGVPGLNSVILAQKGYDVTVTVRPRDYEDVLKVWELLGLRDRVKIIELNTDLNTPFKDSQFDMVWNYLVFDQYKNPLPLTKEMARISKKVVMHFTLGPYNYGIFIHKLAHWWSHRFYDHGYSENATIGSMKKYHKEAGLKTITWGGVDCPIWMDTVDGQLGNSMTYMDAYGMRNKWVWCSANPECRDNKLIKMLWSWEKVMPRWFKILMSHHLYVASKVNSE